MLGGVGCRDILVIKGKGTDHDSNLTRRDVNGANLMLRPEGGIRDDDIRHETLSTTPKLECTLFRNTLPAYVV